MGDISVTVCQDLDLDMPGIFNGLFNIDAVVIKGQQGFRPGLFDLCVQIGIVPQFPDTPAPAAGRRLEHNGITVLIRECGDRINPGFSGWQAFRAWNDGDTRTSGYFPGDHLISQISNDMGWWANENDTGFFTGFRKLKALREKTISGMNGVYVLFAGCPDNLLGIKVVFYRMIADHHGFIGKAEIVGVTVRFFVNGNSRNIQFLQCSSDPEGNLTAVGNQYLLDFFHAIPRLDLNSY